MYNFTNGKKKKKLFAVVCLILVAAMLVTTFISALFVQSVKFVTFLEKVTNCDKINSWTFELYFKFILEEKE